MKHSKETTSLIYELEEIIGCKFRNYNKHDWKESYRQPVHGMGISSYTTQEEITSRYITPEYIKSLHYTMGPVELKIGEALIEVLSRLENRYGLDFNKLEKCRIRNNKHTGE